MKVDAALQPAAATAPPARPVARTANQASTRPVERPHHDEAAENRPHPPTTPNAAATEHAAIQARDDSEPRDAENNATSNDTPALGDATKPAQVGQLLDVLA